MVLRYPRGAIFDLTLEVVLADSATIFNAATTGAGAGINYLLSLDHGAGGYFWTPVDYNTTQ